jgi:hypothetical protein
MTGVIRYLRNLRCLRKHQKLAQSIVSILALETTNLLRKVVAGRREPMDQCRDFTDRQTSPAARAGVWIPR